MITSASFASPQLPPLFEPIEDGDLFLKQADEYPDQFLSVLKTRRSWPVAEHSKVIEFVNKAAKGQVCPGLQHTFTKIVHIVNRILAADFENVKMTTYDALLTAASIVHLERTTTQDECVFVDKQITATRSLQYCPKKRQVAVIANNRHSKIREEGSFKKVVSCALLNLADCTQPAKNGVRSLIDASALDAIDLEKVNSGFTHLQRVCQNPGPNPGICALESKIERVGSLGREISAIFEGYQCNLYHIICDAIFVSDLELLIIMRDLVSGLIKMHDKDIINGDIKPANALCSVDGTAAGAKGALSDFDFAFSTQEGRHQVEVLQWGYYGSFDYTDPQHHTREGEIGETIAYYKELDAWALGCVLLQLWMRMYTLPWAQFINTTYREDFKINKTHIDKGTLALSKKRLFESIQATIEKPLSDLLKKQPNELEFADKVKTVIFGLLRYKPKERMALGDCKAALTQFIDEKTVEENNQRQSRAVQDLEYIVRLKNLAQGDAHPIQTAKKLRELFDLLLNRDSTNKCRPFARSSLEKLLRVAKSIASEIASHPAKVLLSDILSLFTQLQKISFETYPLSIQDAWQLACYLKIELPLNQESGPVVIFLKSKTGLTHDFEYDKRTSLVTVFSRKNRAKTSYAGAFKEYFSAHSFSMLQAQPEMKCTLYMQNKSSADSTGRQMTAKEFRLYEHIKGRLPETSTLPVLLPLTYSEKDPITAVYPEFQGTLMKIANKDVLVTLKQKMSMAEQLLQKLTTLHGVGIAFGDVKASNALFQIHDDESVEAVWTDLGSAYLVDDPNPMRAWAFSAGIYGCVYPTEPQFLGCDRKELSREEHLGLDAWAFGVMLYELFIGQLPWFKEVQKCFKLIEADKNKHPNKPVQNKLYVKVAKNEINRLVQEHIETPFEELQAKPGKTPGDEFTLLAYQLLRMRREDRISLADAHQKMAPLLEIMS